MLMLTEQPGNNLENSLLFLPFLEINPYQMATFSINITTFFSNLFSHTLAFLSFFFFFLATLPSLQDLSSLTRD